MPVNVQNGVHSFLMVLTAKIRTDHNKKKRKSENFGYTGFVKVKKGNLNRQDID